MSYLLAIAIGPVQEFIAAARRTADLQAGSRLLVEIAGEIARELQQRGQLIFPSDPEKDGPNKLLVELTQGTPEEAVQAARTAAQRCLADAWEGVLSVLRDKNLRKHVDEDLALTQIEDFLEFYAAWVPLVEGASTGTNSDAYETARKEVDRLLAGRKSLRHFQQRQEAQQQTRSRRPKSPLDPSRDCALKTLDNGQVPKPCAGYPLWLKTRETLDAVSLLKRVRGVTDVDEESNDRQVPSTSFMAIKAILPEIETIATGDAERSNVIGKAWDTLKALVNKAGTGADMGDFFFPARLQELKDELDKQDKVRLTEDDYKEALQASHLLLKTLGRHEAPPYYAILQADGDRMGQLLSRLKSQEGHLACSAALTRFAEAAKKIVHKAKGHPVYTGGDDVLALLPIHTVLHCAAQLATAFRTEMVTMAQRHQLSLADPEEGGTLSVGIVIVHHMEPLLVSLEHARDAEREAKRTRNALAVALHKRGGEPMICADSWGERPAVTEWNNLIASMTDDLSRGFPYELRTLACEWPEGWERPDLLKAEALRILERKQGGGKRSRADKAAESAKSDAVTWLHQELCRQDTPKKLEAFAKRLVIARFFAEYPLALQAAVEATKEEATH